MAVPLLLTGGVKLGGSGQPWQDVSTYELGATSRLGTGACAHRVRVRGFGVYLYDPYFRFSATPMTSDFWIFVAIAVIVWGFLRLVGRGPPRHRRALPRWYGAVEMILGFALAFLEWLMENEWVTPQEASTLVWVVGGGALLGIFLELLARTFGGIRRLTAMKGGQVAEEERLRSYLRERSAGDRE